MNHRAQFLELQDILQAHLTLWRPSPFYEREPAWCERWPALAEAARALDDERVEHFVADPAASRAWLAGFLPVMAALGPLCDVTALPERALAPSGPHFDWHIPGRKRAQIEAFAAHGPAAAAPLLEWCAGKGHLGRRLALSDGQAVSSLEIEPALCADAEHLARRARVDQAVICGDALAPAARAHLRGREVLALHACGELHRTLARHAAEDGAHGYRIAPCCYYRGAADGYRPVSREARLPLDGRALRLAVTETVTAPQRLRQRLARDQAWKLGFIALRNALEGEAVRPFPPMPATLLGGPFDAYGRAVARRQGVSLPAHVDWAYWEAVGVARRAEVRRFELVRHGFRRALEMWLVLDAVRGFEEAGFAARVGTFCDRTLTPRNLMILAHRAD